MSESHHETAKKMMDDYAKQLGDEGEDFKKDPLPVLFNIMFGMQKQLDAQQKQFDDLLKAVDQSFKSFAVHVDKAFVAIEERVTKLEIKTNH